MLDVHGHSLGESTIEAFRFVKYALLQYSSILDISITRSLLDNVKDARRRYVADLESAKKIEQEEEARKKKLEAKTRLKLRIARNCPLSEHLYNSYRAAWQLRMTVSKKAMINLSSC